jgi:hypothetical protein
MRLLGIISQEWPCASGAPLATERKKAPRLCHCERSEAIFDLGRDCFVAHAPRNDSVRSSALFSGKYKARHLPRLLVSAACWIVLLSPTLGFGQEAATPVEVSSRQKPALVSDVRLLSEQVELSLSDPVEFRGESLRRAAGARLPDRYYVDVFPAILDQRLQTVHEAPDGPVQRVRLSQFRAGMVRVVLDLRGSHTGRVVALTDPPRLLISLNDTAMTTEQPQENQAPSGLTVNEIEPVNVKWRMAPQPWTMLPRVQVSPVATPLPVSPVTRVPVAVDGCGFACAQALPGHGNNGVYQAVRAQAEPGREVETPVSSSSARSRVLHLHTTPQLSFLEPRRETHAAAPDFTPFLTLSPVLAALSETAESSTKGNETFSSDWSWELLCRERGCVQAANRSDASQTVEPSHEPLAEPVSVDSGDSYGPAPETAEFGREETRHIGGVDMHAVWLAVIGVGVLLSFLAGVGVMVLWGRRKPLAQTGKGEGWETRMAYLEEAVNRAGVLNSSFFHSLEISQKRLETLLTQADVTEQNLRRLIHQATLAIPAGEMAGGQSDAAMSGGGRADSFSLAALRLAEGEDAQQVAHTLKLPVAQVRLLQELRQYTQQEKTAAPSEKMSTPHAAPAPVAVAEDASVRLNGGRRNGMGFAQNGQHP